MQAPLSWKKDLVALVLQQNHVFLRVDVAFAQRLAPVQFLTQCVYVTSLYLYLETHLFQKTCKHRMSHWWLNMRGYYLPLQGCSRQVAAGKHISKLSLPGNREGPKTTGPPSRPCRFQHVPQLAVQMCGQLWFELEMSSCLYWVKFDGPCKGFGRHAESHQWAPPNKQNMQKAALATSLAKACTDKQVCCRFKLSGQQPMALHSGK